MEVKYYLKKLKLNELKRVMLLGMAEIDTTRGSDYLQIIENMEGIKFLSGPPTEEWDRLEKVPISITVGKYSALHLDFEFDDYSMVMIDSNIRFDLSMIFKNYLTYLYGEEYVNHLYEKRLKEIAIESYDLLENSEKNISKYLYPASSKKIYKK